MKECGNTFFQVCLGKKVMGQSTHGQFGLYAKLVAHGMAVLAKAGYDKDALKLAKQAFLRAP